MCVWGGGGVGGVMSASWFYIIVVSFPFKFGNHLTEEERERADCLYFCFFVCVLVSLHRWASLQEHLLPGFLTRSC